MPDDYFQNIILKWFDKHGRKNLAWQQNKTPYRVWISEIMLQQTQVATVIPYFERFMHRFPDVQTLNEANEDEVLHLWSGLGYYSRARCLHRAAKIITTQYNAKLPESLAELEALPGIGPSTAAAIYAISYNKPAAILDGNVKRVLTRFHGIREPIDTKAIETQLWHYAHRYAQTERPADYTQALMDMGATCCTPRKPECFRCPLQSHCVAAKLGIAEILPRKSTKPALPVRSASFLILKNSENILLYKRPQQGIWGGLWCLPEISGQKTETELKAYCKKHFQMSIKDIKPLKSFRHTFTHFHLEIFPLLIKLKKSHAKTMATTEQIWYNLNHPQAVGLPKPIQMIMSQLV